MPHDGIGEDPARPGSPSLVVAGLRTSHGTGIDLADHAVDPGNGARRTRADVSVRRLVVPGLVGTAAQIASEGFAVVFGEHTGRAAADELVQTGRTPTDGFALPRRRRPTFVPCAQIGTPSQVSTQWTGTVGFQQASVVIAAMPG